ncbi:UDP-Glycosyltransferase superfamily protein [Rhynchospora pubera]|uniref:Glycosyltransferase n=1 Tax=Rhynchospora pubera TaxID=906938 RepID=A0AAV8FX20_9POAL|nr:UDP-Glycosyltransferase superfamily protein [Rhynchospora pubera]
METQKKPHAVFLPFPAAGHANPLMQLAEILHSRGFHITFVYTEHFYRQLVKSGGSNSIPDLAPDFQFVCLPDNLPATLPDIGTKCTLTQKNCTEPFKNLLRQLMEKTPPPSCVISDAVMTFAMHAAKEFGLPEVQFWTASACGFLGNHVFEELIQRGILPLKDESYMENGFLDTPLDWVPGMKHMRLRDVNTFVYTTTPNDTMINYCIEQMKNCQRSGAIVVNTFHELEKDVLDALATYYPPIYTIGPLANLTDGHLKDNTQNLSIFEANKECLTWLDSKAPNSVVYVNFGSHASMTMEQTKEFGWGLAKCGFDFLWVVRPNIVKGEKVAMDEIFFEEIKDRGLVVSWSPQEMVLKHTSLGLFVTHAGWNSLLEAIVGGVPLVCWPIVAEQVTNCRQLCKVWSNGMELDKNVSRDIVAELVKEMMEGESGKEKRRIALEWKREAEEATSPGGSSSLSLDKLIKHVMLKSE